MAFPLIPVILGGLAYLVVKKKKLVASKGPGPSTLPSNTVISTTPTSTTASQADSDVYGGEDFYSSQGSQSDQNVYYGGNTYQDTSGGSPTPIYSGGSSGPTPSVPPPVTPAPLPSPTPVYGGGLPTNTGRILPPVLPAPILGPPPFSSGVTRGTTISTPKPGGIMVGPASTTMNGLVKGRGGII